MLTHDVVSFDNMEYLFNKPTELDIERRLLLANNGLYTITKTKIFVVVNLINEHIRDTKALAMPRNYINNVILYESKIPVIILETILAAFKYINDKITSELLINVYKNMETGEYIHDLGLTEQIINMAHVSYNYSELEYNPSYKRVAQFHSHNKMDAFWSGTDNADEKNSLPCIFGVIGKLNKNTTIFNMTYKMRVFNSGIETDINLDAIFDMPASISLSPTITNYLDRLVKEHSVARVGPAYTNHDPYYVSDIKPKKYNKGKVTNHDYYDDYDSDEFFTGDFKNCKLKG